MIPIPFDSELLRGVSLNGEREDIHCAISLADITANWGRLEYALYLVLDAIDNKRGATWTEEFTKVNSTSDRRNQVRKLLIKEISDAELHQAFDDLLQRFASLCDERNLIAHAIWRRVGPGQYELMPLQRARASKVLKFKKVISHRELHSMLTEIEFIGQRFAAFSANLMAYQYSERVRKKRADAEKRKRTK
jgi:hypothetical protein